MNKDAKRTIKTVKAEAKKMGLSIPVVEVNKHIKVYISNPVTGESRYMTMGCSPSDHRAHKNAMKTARSIFNLLKEA